MVNRETTRRQRTRRVGALQTDLMIAVAILSLAAIPLVVSMTQDQRQLRAHYYRAVAMEIVDGEMEILATGEWRKFENGKHTYVVKAMAATNLPGQFSLTRSANTVRLEWNAGKPGKGGKVAREITVNN